MPAAGATAVTRMNQASGSAHGEAVLLPWQIVRKGNLNCFTSFSIFWTAIIRQGSTGFLDLLRARLDLVAIGILVLAVFFIVEV